MNAFVAARRPALAEILMGIRSHAMTDNDRYVVVSVAGGLGYVQCMMIRGDSEVYCEGRSGFYDKEAGPSPGARAALRGLGFGGDPARGNFKLRRPCATEADVWFTADLMLEALYRAYGARPGTDLMVDAPLVQRIRKSLLGRRPPRD